MKKSFYGLLLMAFAIACSAKVEEEAEIVPDIPQNVRLVSSDDHSAVLAWDAVEGAVQYVARLERDGKLVNDGQKNVKTPEVSYNGLTKGEYSLKVRSNSGTVKSDYTDPFLFTIGSDDNGGTDNPDPNPNPDIPDDPQAYPYYDSFDIPELEDNLGKALSFPGAEGGGMYTTGGRGGKIIHVTNLEDSGTGSLRAAIQEKGARIVVFDVAGTIYLKSRLEIKNGDLTIAGQTAPGDGICIKGQNVRINTSNVIIRFMRFRMGDIDNVEDDALNCYTHDSFNNVIVDHCSLSWSTDECGSFYGIKDFSLQYCILSESLRISVHDKGRHGYGGIWGGENASYHHNLIAHHDSRNPRFDHGYVNTMAGPIHYYNNVVYNWGSNSSYGGENCKDKPAKKINMYRNYYKPGPATSSNSISRFVNPTTKCSNCNSSNQYDIVYGQFYLAENYMYGSEEVTADNSKGVVPDDKSKLSQVLVSSYQGTKPLYSHSAEKAFDKVVSLSGASLKRDSIDERIAREAKNGTSTYSGSQGSTGGLIDSQEDVGGWPTYSGTALKDSDGDGMPDAFERDFGLDPNDASDGSAKTLDKLGRYSNIEMYLHYIVKDIVNGQFSDLAK